MRRIPHFRIPLQEGPRGFATVEQDTFDEIVQSVTVVLRTRPGEMLTAPDFGLVDPTFSVESEMDSGIVEAIQEHEPRADVAHVDVAMRRAALGVARVEMDDGGSR